MKQINLLMKARYAPHIPMGPRREGGEGHGEPEALGTARESRAPTYIIIIIVLDYVLLLY